MRVESSVTSVSWIPSEAVKGLGKMAFEHGVTHYDEPLPDTIDDLESLLANDAFRFANQLRAWVEVDGGRITGHGYSGAGVINSTRVKIGPARATFQPTALPDIQEEPVVGSSSVRFVQTTGGRSGAPAPRRVKKKPFVQFSAPLVWTTLALTIYADGSSDYEVVGASTFPRHWIYDSTGSLVAKVGLTDFKDWYKTAFGRHTPWGDENSPALVTAAETALERQLSTTIMRGGAKPKIRNLKEGETLVEQGQPGKELFLLLDGVLSAEVDGDLVADLGPGAVLGERSVLEGAGRTATLRAMTPCRVAEATIDQIDVDALAELSQGHRREDHK